MLALALLVPLFLLLGSCYLPEQVSRYLGLRSRAIPVAKALADPHTSPELKSFLERVAGIKAFGESSFGLRQTKSYRSIVMLDADRLATVVSACAELSFTTYEWNYPFVGKLPYRGYFDRHDATAEAERLKKQGYDVLARPVDAFSTLGWISDPLFSFMASYPEANVADTVLHEMTHATIWSTGHDQFNEELASFVGDEGSLLYLGSEYGEDSKQLASARADRDDADAFALWLKGTASELQTVYASTLPADQKRAQKARIIAERAAAFVKAYDSLFHGPAYRDFPMDRLNNAYLDLYRLYAGEPELYRDFYVTVSGSSMKDFISRVSHIVKKGGDPKVEMRREIEAATPTGK